MAVDSSAGSPRPSELQLRRNLLLGILNGMLGRFSQDMINPALVLTWFVSDLGAPVAVIGLLAPVSMVAGYVAQLLSASHIQRQSRKMPAYRMMAALRVLCWALIVAAVLLLGRERPSLLLALFLLVYVAYSMLRGASGLAFQDIVGKTVPPQRRGRFFGWRQFTGGLLALAGSVLVSRMLDDQSGLTFPTSYAAIFAIAGLAGMIGHICFALIVEPDAAGRSPQLPFAECVERMWGILRQDSSFRWFACFVCALLFSTVAAPFYSLFAKEQLGVPSATAGTYLGAFTAGLVGSTLPWGRLNDRAGSRALLFVAGLLSVVPPVLPLLLNAGMSSSAFVLVFALLGSARTAFEIGYMSFVLDAAPIAHRVLYITLASSVVGVVHLLLMAGGFVAEQWGIRAVFASSAASALLSVLLIRGVQEPRSHTVL
jgi:MFS family permease